MKQSHYTYQKNWPYRYNKNTQNIYIPSVIASKLKGKCYKVHKKIKGQKAMNYKVDQLLSSKTSNADMSQNVSCTQKCVFAEKNIERDILCVFNNYSNSSYLS